MFRSQSVDATLRVPSFRKQRQPSVIRSSPDGKTVWESLKASALFLRKAMKMQSEMSINDLPALPLVIAPATTTARLREIWADELQKKKPSLLRAMFRLISPILVITTFLNITSILMNLALPFLTAGVVRAVFHRMSYTRTCLLPVAMFFASLISTCSMQTSFLSQACAAITSWGAISTLLIEHPSRMTTSERARFTEGQILNLLTTDCQAVIDVMLFMGFYITMPLQIIIAAAALFSMLGVSFLAGLAILTFNVWLSERFGNRVKSQQNLKNSIGDKRNVLLNESFQGIRTIKLYSWEDFIVTRVGARRAEEIKHLSTMGSLRGWQTFLTLGFPVAAMVVTFVLYAALNDELQPDVIFLSAGLFEFLNMGMAVFPNAVNEFRRMSSSVNRIGKFLSSSGTYSAEVFGEEGQILVENANFSWDYHKLVQEHHEKLTKELAMAKKKKKFGSKFKKAIRSSKRKILRRPKPPKQKPQEQELTTTNLKNTLADISLNIKKGEFACIVGRVGSGKSSLISGVLGLLHRLKGDIRVGGRTAYVPQQAFVMNDTVRNNILFGGEFEEERYNQVVSSCELAQDIAMLPAGDMSEVGEKGITISGGQKQRLAIARAAYAQPDIVLLDDPLSAMDAHVGRKVFENCLKSGPLGNSTRLMVTNQLQYCENVDRIFVLVDGAVVESGSHHELMKLNGHYVSLAQFVVGKNEQDQHQPEEALEELANEIVPLKAKPEAVAAPVARNGPSAAAPGGPQKSGSLMSTEKKALGRIGFQTFAKMAAASGSGLLGFFVTVLLLVCPVLQYLVNFFLAKWCDHSQSVHSKYLIFYVCAAGIFSLAAGTRSVVFNRFFIRASANLHQRMLRSVLSAPMSFFDTTPIGRVLNRFGGDVMQLDLLLPRIFEMWSYLFGMTLVVILASGILVPHVLVVSVALIALFATLYIKVGAVILDIRRILMTSYSPLMAFFSGYINGLDSIRAFGRVELFFNKFKRLQLGPVTALFYMTSVQMIVNSIVLGFAVAVFMGVLSMTLILLRDTDWISPGNAGLVLSYSTILAMRVPVVFFLSTMLEQLMSASQRVIEYIGIQPEGVVKDKNGVIIPPRMAPLHWPSTGLIELRNVVMSYRPGLPPVLRGVTVTFQPGEKVGVVGRTGAGKSSLILALFRMVEVSEGQILIDGQDISTIQLHELRDKLGMIPQDPYMFSGTIRSNLDVIGQYTDEQIWEALRMVNLEATVRSYEGGLDCVVKEKGDNFSAGTIQLFCMARVLLKKPKIIFMDEATASVDLETDSLVQATIRQSFKDCTIITIAHRLNTVIDYDKVLVMDKGTVAEFGSPHQLLSNTDGFFWELVKHTGESSANELKARAKAAFGKI